MSFFFLPFCFQEPRYSDILIVGKMKEWLRKLCDFPELNSTSFSLRLKAACWTSAVLWWRVVELLGLFVRVSLTDRLETQRCGSVVKPLVLFTVWQLQANYAALGPGRGQGTATSTLVEVLEVAGFSFATQPWQQTIKHCKEKEGLRRSRHKALIFCPCVPFLTLFALPLCLFILLTWTFARLLPSPPDAMRKGWEYLPEASEILDCWNQSCVHTRKACTQT